jgi:arylsulfatase A-like enzyme
MHIPASPQARGSQPSRFAGLTLALVLGLVLLLLSYVRIIPDSQSAMLRSGVFTSLFQGSIWDTTLLRNMIWFGVAQATLHLAFGMLCWALARLSFFLWPSQTTRVPHHVLMWFLGFTATIFLANAGRVPHSSLGEGYVWLGRFELIGMQLWKWFALATTAAVIVTTGTALFRWLSRSVQARKPAAVVATVAALAATLAIVLPPRRSEPVAGKPNVIFIGLDSLRSDVAFSPERTPNLDAFLSGGGVSFTNAMTPLARTFPSMTSVLTGRRPHSTGAIINLLPRDLVREGDTLPRVLKRAGYETAYATDEVRFSNIDASYGFDTTVTPPIGASEFILSFLCDSPLSNTIINTPLGALLFPHVHANRGAYVTYDPDRFLHRVDREIEFRQPLFLLTHFTLSHWPYTWIDSAIRKPAKEPDDSAPRPTWPAYYLDAVKRVDQQFGDLMAMLERRGVLENAIVVVFSDHGEAFGYPSELIAPSSSSALAVLKVKSRWGHGTSVLTPSQYRTVLAIRGFGASRFENAAGRKIDVPVATYDIAPTIAHLLSVSSRDGYQGMSLAPFLQGGAGAEAAFASRIRFTETEFAPSGIATANGSVSPSVVAAVAAFYDVNPLTDRLEIKRKRINELLRIRQYAAVGSELLLAAVPGPCPAGFCYVQVGTRGGTPKIVARVGADAPAELQTLWKALHEEYKFLDEPTSDNDIIVTPPITATAAKLRSK